MSEDSYRRYSATHQSTTTSEVDFLQLDAQQRHGEDFTYRLHLSASPRSHRTSPVRTPNGIKRALKHENSFRLEPTEKFFPDKVEEIIRCVLSEGLAEVSYDPGFCAQYACELSERIQERVKQLKIRRHKLVSLVNIGELQGQGVIIGSRCLWNAKFDSFATSTFKNKTLFAVGIVYGVYFE